MKKIISSTSKFRHAAKIALAVEIAQDAFTEILESLRAKNTDGQDEETASRDSKIVKFKKWGSVSSQEANGESLEQITSKFESCLSELTKLVKFMMQSETGIKGENFDPIKKALRELGGYDDKKKKEVQTFDTRKVGRLLTPERFKALSEAAMEYQQMASRKSKNQNQPKSYPTDTYDAISKLLENKGADHGLKKIKICELIQQLYQVYFTESQRLFTVSEGFNTQTNAFGSKHQRSDVVLPPQPELLLQTLLLLNPENSTLPSIFAEKSAIDINFFMQKVSVKKITETYDYAVIERLIVGLETWTKAKENQTNPNHQTLKQKLNSLYDALIIKHKEEARSGVETINTLMVKVIMKLPTPDFVSYMMSAKDHNKAPMLDADMLKELVMDILNKEIDNQKKETTPFRSNTPAMRLLRSFILRLSGNFFPDTVVRLLQRLNHVEKPDLEGATQDDVKAYLSDAVNQVKDNLQACLSPKTQLPIPHELTQFLLELKNKIEKEFPKNHKVILENFIVLRILGADILSQIQDGDLESKAKLALADTLQKAIKSQKEEGRLPELDRFLNNLYSIVPS
jgi:hypothetical protein